MSEVRVIPSKSELSATEKLRAMLDERGIEYTTNDFGYCHDTVWDGGSAAQLTNDSGLMMSVTPEQAIAATVGAGTCRKLPSTSGTECIIIRHGAIRHFGYWKCSSCGTECFEGARYCMNCGAKAVSE